MIIQANLAPGHDFRMLGSGPLALGDPVYTTTLLPGEQVRLATTDRRSRYSFDSESKLSYRSEQMSEEQYRMTGLRTFMTDENVVDRGEDHPSSSGNWDFHGDASGGLGFFSVSADTNARGSHNAQSASDYMREHRAHAEMADHQSVEATRKAHSLSVGEVSSRTHVQGESEDHFESSSRTFSNPNRCHAVTFIFYHMNKTETIRLELLSIDRRVIVGRQREVYPLFDIGSLQDRASIRVKRTGGGDPDGVQGAVFREDHFNRLHQALANAWLGGKGLCALMSKRSNAIRFICSDADMCAADINSDGNWHKYNYNRGGYFPVLRL